MRKVLSFALIILFLSGCAYHYVPEIYLTYKKAKPIIISEQVGEVIDPEERDKFNLFHGIEGFKSAIFYDIYDERYPGGYLVEITTENKRLEVVNRDPLDVEILIDYIDRYEEIKDDRKEFENKWMILTYDYLGQPITQYEVDRVIQRKNTAGLVAGCCLLGFVPNTVIALLIGGFQSIYEDPLKRPELFWATLILTSALDIIIGAKIGGKKDRENAINAIRIARLPKVIE